MGVETTVEWVSFLLIGVLTIVCVGAEQYLAWTISGKGKYAFHMEVDTNQLRESKLRWLYFVVAVLTIALLIGISVKGYMYICEEYGNPFMVLIRG